LLIKILGITIYDSLSSNVFWKKSSILFGLITIYSNTEEIDPYADDDIFFKP